MDLESRNIHIFLERYNIKNEAGLALDFNTHPFLQQPYEDLSPVQCIMKPPQIGATVMMVNKSLWVAKYKQKDIIYTLPTQSDVGDMAGGKVNRIIAQNPIYKEWVKEHDSVEQKTVGDNIIYYRGTWTNKQAMMVSSDLNIHDEVDASKQDVITQYETRLQAKADGWRWYFSHPSTAGSGIDLMWQKSDQKEWFILCCTCNKWQFMEWPFSVDLEKAQYKCKFCNAYMPPEAIRHGEWRRKHPERTVSGYHISQMMCPWIPASKIIKDFNEKPTQYFYNQVLGLPYADASNTVTLKVIEDSLITERQPRGRVVIGVDTGIDIRYVIGDMNGLFDFGEVKSYEDLERVCNRYQDWVMVIDQGGDIIGSRSLAEKYAGRVFLCYFQKDKKSMQLIKWGEKSEFGKVMADRNRGIQLVVDEMNALKIPIFGTIDKWFDYWVHWSHVYRTSERDALGNLEYVWNRNDRDDWVLATLYWRIGVDRFGWNTAIFAGRSDGAESKIPTAPVVDHRGQTTYPRIFAEKSSESDWRYR